MKERDRKLKRKKSNSMKLGPPSILQQPGLSQVLYNTCILHPSSRSTRDFFRWFLRMEWHWTIHLLLALLDMERTSFSTLL